MDRFFSNIFSCGRRRGHIHRILEKPKYTKKLYIQMIFNAFSNGREISWIDEISVIKNRNQ
jgi:hypothetical protein